MLNNLICLLLPVPRIVGDSSIKWGYWYVRQMVETRCEDKKPFVKISNFVSRGQRNWTNTSALLSLIDNYCEVFLGILSILAVGGISVYLSGENLDHLYMYFVQTLWKEGISKKVLSERSCSLFSTVPTVCTTPPIPPRGRLSISVTIIFDHFYFIITITSSIITLYITGHYFWT